MIPMTMETNFGIIVLLLLRRRFGVTHARTHAPPFKTVVPNLFDVPVTQNEFGGQLNEISVLSYQVPYV